MTRPHKLEPHPLDIPAFLRIPQEVRRKAWEKRPPVAIPFARVEHTRQEDEATQRFRAEEAERKRIKSLDRISKMKSRLSAKAIDHSRMRWDPRKNKFVEDVVLPKPKVSVTGRFIDKSQPNVQTVPMKTREVKAIRNAFVKASQADIDWSRITKDTAEEIAKLNGVWKDSYEKLRGTGRIVMTVANVLKGVVRRGGEVKW